MTKLEVMDYESVNNLFKEWTSFEMGCQIW